MEIETLETPAENRGIRWGVMKRSDGLENRELIKGNTDRRETDTHIIFINYVFIYREIQTGR